MSANAELINLAPHYHKHIHILTAGIWIVGEYVEFLEGKNFA